MGKRLSALAVVFGGGLLALTIATVPIAQSAFAQEEATPTDQVEEATKTEPLDNFLDTLAENLGIPRDELDDAIKATQIDLIDQWAADMKERVESGEGGFGFGAFGPFDLQGPLTQTVPDCGPFGKGMIEGAFGPDLIEIGPDETGVRGSSTVIEVRPGSCVQGLPGESGMIHVIGEESFHSLADFLGISTDELISERRGGKSLIDIAADHGKTVDQLEEFLVDQATKRIDELLGLPSEEANEPAVQATPEA
jgi:hypothetical protein